MSGYMRKEHIVKTANGDDVDRKAVIAESFELSREYEKLQEYMFRKYPAPHYYHFCDKSEGTEVTATVAANHNPVPPPVTRIGAHRRVAARP